MAEIDRSEVSIRFIGDVLDPREISARLDVEPTHGVRKGDVWSTPNGTEVVARIGTWFLKAEPRSPGDVERQVSALFAQMGNDLDAWREIAARYDGHIFAGLFLAAANEGFRLSPEILSAIASRGLALDLDIYGFGQDDES